MENLNITIDLTKGMDNTFKQIEEASKLINGVPKMSLWQRIKSLFNNKSNRGRL